MENIVEEVNAETLTNEILTDITLSPSCPEPQNKSRKGTKDKKKDHKSVEQFMESLNYISNVDEKLSSVCRKYVQATEEINKLQFYIKQSEKRYAVTLKEKEHLQYEYNRTTLVKSKLENLCRELQKQNKAVKEQSLLKIREEEERRKETQAKFQSTLSEITIHLQQNNEKNVKLRDDNICISEKFKSVVQQYELREQQVDKMAKQMALESQLADAKLKKANLEHQTDRKRLEAEIEGLKMTLAQYRAKMIEMQETESALKGQIAVYTEKYDEFQSALTKSNQVFGGFKEQMEMMSIKIKKLEKESLSWKKRWESSQTALLDMCGERQVSEERATATNRQLQHMQNLCRTLQAERSILLMALKEHNIERPPLPGIPSSPSPSHTPSKASDSKMDAMVANCAQLRQSFAHLQSQLNVLTTSKEPNGQSAKLEKPKKSKLKKSKAEKQAGKSGAVKGDLEESECDKLKANETASVSKEANCNLEAQSKSQTKVNKEINSDALFEQSTTAKNNIHGKFVNKTVEPLMQAINTASVNPEHLVVSETEAANKQNVGDNLMPAGGKIEVDSDITTTK